MPAIIAGILNLTPDSFSDGGRFPTIESAVSHGIAMVEEGADWIDIGGESTRPNSTPVPEDEEIERVVPVIEQLAKKIEGNARISIDTYKASTARAALSAGARVINDISGGHLDPEILQVASAHGATLVLGHLRGRPETMMSNIHFDDVLEEVGTELEQRVFTARAAGCRDVWVDPGIGFGKKLEHNLQILAGLRSLRDRLGVPMMVGVSRKRFVGDLTNKPVHLRTFGTAAGVAAAIWGGVDAVRVHDVKEMRDVVKVAEAIASFSPRR
jgi:dihydropteroate synthase